MKEFKKNLLNEMAKTNTYKKLSNTSLYKGAEQHPIVEIFLYNDTEKENIITALLRKYEKYDLIEKLWDY